MRKQSQNQNLNLLAYAPELYLILRGLLGGRFNAGIKEPLNLEKLTNVQQKGVINDLLFSFVFHLVTNSTFRCVS